MILKLKNNLTSKRYIKIGSSTINGFLKI